MWKRIYTGEAMKMLIVFFLTCGTALAQDYDCTKEIQVYIGPEFTEGVRLIVFNRVVELDGSMETRRIFPEAVRWRPGDDRYVFIKCDSLYSVGIIRWNPVGHYGGSGNSEVMYRFSAKVDSRVAADGTRRCLIYFRDLLPSHPMRRVNF